MRAVEKFEDSEIVEALKKGSKDVKNQALRYLYKAIYPKVLAHVNRNQGQDEQAKDVFQDAMIIFCKKIENDQFEMKSSTHTFLIGIAKNLWLRHLSKTKKESTTILDVEPKDEIDMSNQEADEFENRKKLSLLLNKIGDACKSLLVNYYYQNRSIAELTRLIQVQSEQVTRNKIYRCMQKLRQVCADHNISQENFSYHES